jgi:photosystem II stability/assembly factor-like uncharacterized protein
MHAVVAVPLLGLFFLWPATCTLFAQETWQKIESGTSVDLYTIQFVDLVNGYAAGDNGTVIKSTDGGKSWSDVSIPTSFPVRALSFLTANSGWAVTGDIDNPDNSGSMWYTSDGGENWTHRPHNSTRARFGVSFVSDNFGWACGARNGPLDITATTDGGQTFVTQTSASIFGWTYGIKAVSSDVVWATGGTYFPAVSGFLLYSTNGGRDWEERATGVLPFFYAIDFNTGVRGYAVGESGSVYRTPDAGQTWQPVSVNSSSTLRSVSFPISHFGWVCGDDGAMFRTNNGGQSWSDLSFSSKQRLNGVFSFGLRYAWAVGESGGIWLYNDGTSSVTQPDAKSFSMHVYPLPAQSLVTLRVDGDGVSEHRHHLRIRDILGVERYALEYTGAQEITLTTETLGNGVFFYECLRNSRDRVTGKFMLIPR